MFSRILNPKMKIDWMQCDHCEWRLSYGCSQQLRRPKEGDNCPTFSPKWNETPK